MHYGGHRGWAFSCERGTPVKKLLDQGPFSLEHGGGSSHQLLVKLIERAERDGQVLVILGGIRSAGGIRKYSEIRPVCPLSRFDHLRVGPVQGRPSVRYRGTSLIRNRGAGGTPGLPSLSL